MKSKYTYPDPGDAITFKVIGEFEAMSGYWGRSERWVLDNIHNIIQKSGIANYTLLDVGCGEGRLFSDFINGASKIVGIEPDPVRYANAKICVNENRFDNKVLLLNSTLEQAHLHEEFDIVLSSHIIQHIPTNAVEPHLKRLADLTQDGGLLIINTNTSNREDEFFVKGEIHNDKVSEVEISVEEFDALTQSTGALPVHMFNRDKVCSLMSSLGFDLVSMLVFHVDSQTQREYGKDVDQIVNSDQNLARKHGRDISFVFRKQHFIKTIERGAMATFCAFNVPLFGMKDKEVGKCLEVFRQQNSVLFNTTRFCLDCDANTKSKDAYNKDIANTECKCGDIADEFCKTGQQINNSFRYYIGTTFFNFKGRMLPLKASVTFFPYRNIGIVCFNTIIKNLSVDEVIALKQFLGNYSYDMRYENWRERGVIRKEIVKDPDSGEQKVLEYRGAGDYFANDSNAANLNEIDGKFFWFACKNLIEDISKTLRSCAPKDFSIVEKVEYMQKENEELEVIIDSFDKLHVSRFIYTTLEINSTNYYQQLDDAQSWGLRNCKSLYGLLVGDEGYKFVPKTLAKKRLTEYNWSTRNFVNIFAYCSNIIMLNFKTSSSIGLSYMKRQEEWSDAFYDKGRNFYFTMAPCIAGVDHGLFRIVERNLVIYFENEYISKFDQSSAIGINKKRDKILLFIYKTGTSMDEINDLFNVIAEASGTARTIDSIRQRLDLRSEEKNLTNQSQNNHTILVLTITSIFLGMLAIGGGSNAFQYFDYLFGFEFAEFKAWAYLLIAIVVAMLAWWGVHKINWNAIWQAIKLGYHKIMQLCKK